MGQTPVVKGIRKVKMRNTRNRQKTLRAPSISKHAKNLHPDSRFFATLRVSRLSITYCIGNCCGPYTALAASEFSPVFMAFEKITQPEQLRVLNFREMEIIDVV